MVNLFSYEEVKLIMEFLNSEKNLKDFCAERCLDEASMQQMLMSHNKRLESLKKTFATREERLKNRFDMQMSALRQQKEQAIEAEKEQQDMEVARAKAVPARLM